MTLPARKVDPGQKAGTVLKPWRETVGSVLEFSTPADKIMIMRVINVAKAGLEHLLKDYIEYHGGDTDDMGPPLRWWFQFALGKNVVMAPPDPAANPRPGVCWSTLMEPFTKFEAKEREEALMRAAAATIAAAQGAATAAAAASARAAEATRYGAGAKRVRDDDKGGGGSGHGQQGGGGDKRDPKHAKGKDGGRAQKDATGAGPPLQPYSMRVDPHCVQNPDEKMTDDVCPIHGNGHKRADCNYLVKPGLNELKDEEFPLKSLAPRGLLLRELAPQGAAPQGASPPGGCSSGGWPSRGSLLRELALQGAAPQGAGPPGGCSSGGWPSRGSLLRERAPQGAAPQGAGPPGGRSSGS